MAEKIREPIGAIQGPPGTTFTPSVSANLNLSWSNDGGLTNPQTVNIKDAIPAATTSEAGLMSANDKSTLNGLETAVAAKADAATVATLIGNDTGKSARTIAAEELAVQLIPANAQASRDTLQEIAAWIQGHPDEAAALNYKLTLGTNNGTEYATVKDYVEAMVNGLIGLTALSAAVTGNGNAVTGVSYDSVTGAFAFTKGLTFLTDHQDISGKVDKVPGKGLSTEDYTAADKNKLAGMEAQANKTVIDDTLSVTGNAADAKATGDAVAALQAENTLLKELIKGSDATYTRTVTGNPATLDDAKAVNFQNVTVTITPTQNGTPTLDNPVSITGATSVTVTREGENGANQQSVTVTLTDGTNPLTVYAGTLDVTAGTLTVTHKLIEKSVADMNNSEPYPGWNSGNSAFNDCFPPSTNNYKIQNVQTNIGNLKRVYGTRYASSMGPFWIPTETINMTQTEWKTNYPNLTIQFLLPLLTPATYALTAQNLAALSGYNNVSADAGTLSVTYKADLSLTLEG